MNEVTWKELRIKWKTSRKDLVEDMRNGMGMKIWKKLERNMGWIYLWKQYEMDKSVRNKWRINHRKN